MVTFYRNKHFTYLYQQTFYRNKKERNILLKEANALEASRRSMSSGRLSFARGTEKASTFFGGGCIWSLYENLPTGVKWC